MAAVAASALLLLAGCGGGGDEVDPADAQACGIWDEIHSDSSISNAAAARALNDIADTAANRPLHDRAIDLAILLERGATQTEIGEAVLDVDAACLVATNQD